MFALLSAKRDSTDVIGDKRFANQLTELQNLKRFLFEEKVKFESEQMGAIDLGPLNNLRYRPYGRLPNLEEWKLLDAKLSALASLLDGDLRQRIRIRELSKYFGAIPMAFLFASIVSIMYYLLYSRFLSENSLAFNISYLASIMVWTLSQGGLGACAFLGTRVAMRRAQGVSGAQVLEEIADITDQNILKIRILLGCAFSILLGLPFSNRALSELLNYLYGDAKSAFDATGFAFVVVPFMLGFSTNLVLAIFDRMVSSIRTFFGITT